MMIDKNGHEIALGSVLWCDDGYAVIVRRDQGRYYGRLICDPLDSCGNAEYALNNGRGYTVIYSPEFNAITDNCPDFEYDD